MSKKEEYFTATQVGTILESLRNDISIIAEDVRTLRVDTDILKKDVAELKTDMITVKDVLRISLPNHGAHIIALENKVFSRN